MSKRSVDVKSREKGFTLVESMVAIIIFLILLALGLIGYRPFVNRARVAKAASAANCLRAATTGFSEWSPEKQQTTFNQLAGTPADFYQTSEALGCTTGPTVSNLRAEASLAVRICLLTITRPDGTKYEILCANFNSSSLAPGDTVDDYKMVFQVPKVTDTQIRLAPQGVNILDTPAAIANP